MLYTKEELKITLRKLGLRSGMNIVLDVGGDCCHILGSEKAILEAVIEIIGYDATLLVPSFTTYLSHHVSRNEILDYETLHKIEYSYLPFDIRKTLPESNMAKQLMTYDDALRSNHPLYSFVAWGKYAQTIVSQHPLHFGLTNASPIGKMMELSAFYLSLNSIDQVLFKFAQSATRLLEIGVQVVPIIYRDQKVSKEILEYRFDSKLYNHIQSVLEKENLIFKQSLGEYQFKLCSIIKTYPLIQLLFTK